MTKKFEDILNAVNSDVLNEQSKKSIVEAFENAVNEKVDSRVKLEIDDNIKRLDEKHTELLQTLLEAIDEDHTNKLKKVLLKVDSDYSDKLTKVIEKYEGMVKKEAIAFRDTLTTEMSNYMDMYLEKMIPRDQIQEAVNNTQAKRIIEKVKELVSIDEDFISDTIRDALQDGKNRIDSLTHELNEAIKSNIQINQDFKKTKSLLILEQKTADFDDNKRCYVMRVLNEKSPEEIEENFDYVVEMFERDEADEANILTEQATSKVKSNTIDTPVDDTKTEDIITETTVVSTEQRHVAGYLDMLKEQDG